MVETDISPKEALKKFFGFSKFKGDQEAVIINLLAGNSTFVLMPTGGGKSLCYQLPALMMGGVAIVVSPLIALMKNQVDAIRGFSEEDGIAHFLNSSLNKAQLLEVKEDVSSGKTKLLYVAPESLTKDENVEFFKSVEISFFAIDEAHCISEWGHDFRPEYRRLKDIMNEIAIRPFIALTATATDKVQQDILKNLGRLDATVFKASFNRHNLYYEIRPKENVFREIIKLVKTHGGKSGIIYCLSRKKVEELAEALQVNGVKALPYHAGMDSKTRAKTQDQFLMEDVDVIVATIAFGMGIDKPDVRFVIHHDIPKSIEGYYQETGRAGRDGGEGNCYVFYSYKDIEKLEKFLQGKPVAEQEIGMQLLQDTVSYAETAICRRKYLLFYFGEEYDDENCHEKCDNCRYPRAKQEAKDDVVKLLEIVKDIKERHKMNHIVNILMGITNADMKTYHHISKDYFGEGVEKGEKYWYAAIRQMLVKGLLKKEIETYGELHLTDLGTDFMKKPHSIMLSEERDFKSENNANIILNQSAAGGGDPNLIAILKDIRKDVANKNELPPYVIFQDPSIDDMAIRYPTDIDELSRISGVGVGKANKYGAKFVEVIKRYVKENEIERPADMVVRTVAKKSASKVYIIINIDKKRPLEDIAKSQGLSMDALLDQLEGIIHSGTKLNIDYCVRNIIDEDNIEEIIEYFKEAENDSIDEAFEEFDGDFTEEELRMVRIIFMTKYSL